MPCYVRESKTCVTLTLKTIGKKIPHRVVVSVMNLPAPLLFVDS